VKTIIESLKSTTRTDPSYPSFDFIKGKMSAAESLNNLPKVIQGKGPKPPAAPASVSDNKDKEIKVMRIQLDEAKKAGYVPAGKGKKVSAPAAAAARVGYFSDKPCFNCDAMGHGSKECQKVTGKPPTILPSVQTARTSRETPCHSSC